VEFTTNSQSTVAEFVVAMIYSDHPMVHACLTTRRQWTFLWIAERDDQKCMHRFTQNLAWSEGLRYLTTLLQLDVPSHRQFIVCSQKCQDQKADDSSDE
jgi:uncharacterized protein with GYD domain